MVELATPLRANAPGLPAGPPPVLVPTAAPVPVNPATILAQQQPASPRKGSRRWIYWGAGGLVAAQLILPPPLKPLVLAGDAAGSFYGGIMAASTANQLTLAQQQALAARIAELEARRADALGNCMWANLLAGGEGRMICEGLVNDRFESSLVEARRALGRR